LRVKIERLAGIVVGYRAQAVERVVAFYNLRDTCEQYIKKART
jgi:hypothetical protein